MIIRGRARDLTKRVVPASARRALNHYILSRDSVIALGTRSSYRKAHSSYRRRVLHRKAILERLDIQLTDHCNLRCRSCNHFSPLSPPAFASPEVFDNDITRLAELCDNIEWMNLVGGEPLLHPEVLVFARLARSAFPSARIALTTNGLLLKKMSDEFWQQLVSLRVQLNISVYPVSLDTESIKRTADRHRVHVEFIPIGEFRKIPIRAQGCCDPVRAFHGCDMCPLLRDGRIYPCAFTGLAGILEDRFGAAPPVAETDSVGIYDVADGYEIVRFLSHPVEWCRHCDIDATETAAWSPSKALLEEWT